MRNFHLRVGGRRYAVSVEREAGPGRLKVVLDGQVHIVEVEEEEGPRPAAPRARPAAAPPSARPPRPVGGGGGPVVAPIPGVVLSVEVEEGQSVQAGDRLLLLEAMKMENIIAAEAAGTVRSIRVRVGDKVEAGQELMEIT